MRTRAVAMAVAALTVSAVALTSSAQNYNPDKGYVPDAATAIRIAEAVWLPIYGRDIEKEKPFVAERKGDVWTVKGSLPKGKVVVGGVAEAEIASSTGCVIRVSHGK